MGIAAPDRTDVLTLRPEGNGLIRLIRISSVHALDNPAPSFSSKEISTDLPGRQGWTAIATPPAFRTTDRTASAGRQGRTVNFPQELTEIVMFQMRFTSQGDPPSAGTSLAVA
ncbi:MAG: hypothetical protein D3906_03995 [Candidatus Electrothrix sp. AUS1_2]|nr:hypothetical protein [Candidatus Electrothrix sp. AUS1_2]